MGNIKNTEHNKKKHTPNAEGCNQVKGNYLFTTEPAAETPRKVAHTHANRDTVYLPLSGPLISNFPGSDRLAVHHPIYFVKPISKG
jgi:hypothetical protein